MTFRPHEVVVIAVDDVVAFDLSLASRVLGSATNDAGELLYDVRTGSVDGRPVRTTAGFAALPDHGLEVLATAGTVVVPGPHRGSPLTGGTLPAALREALRGVAGRARLVSICSGSFVLAAAGLLDGRPATTHWALTERFRRLYPQVRLDPDVLFTDDGDVLTSAGAAAGLDLCLHLVRSDHGSGAANRAARTCVVPSWREGGQSQFIERPLPELNGASTGTTRAWALERLDGPLSLRGLAEHARMSVRTFTRRFREETGMTAGQWLLRQRTERARRLLETTDLTIDEVAAQTGFGTAASLRQQLRAAVGVGPSVYRRAFRARDGGRRAGVA